MLIELCVHTAIPGQLDPALGLLRETLIPAQQRTGARLLFLSTGQGGALNEAVLAWQHDSLAACEAAHRALDADADAAAAGRTLGRHLRRQARQFVVTTPFTTVTPPPPEARLVDWRCYSFRPGTLDEFLPVCASEGFPAQQRHCGHLVFHGVALAPDPNQLVQAWAYTGQLAYDEGQAALFRDPAWAGGYRQRVLHLVDEQEHRHLRLLRHAPAGPAVTPPPAHAPGAPATGA